MNSYTVNFTEEEASDLLAALRKARLSSRGLFELEIQLLLRLERQLRVEEGPAEGATA